MFQSILNQNLYPIRETIIQKPKECFSFDECYQYFVCHYPQTELGADVLIMDYQQAINKNRYFEKEYPIFANELWLFADNASGDEWFLHKQNKQVLFYDHEQGEYSSFDDFVMMSVDFYQFVDLMMKLDDFQQKLDKGLISNPQHYFAENVYIANPHFFNQYPYEIF